MVNSAAFVAVDIGWNEDIERAQQIQCNVEVWMILGPREWLKINEKTLLGKKVLQKYTFCQILC